MNDLLSNVGNWLGEYQGQRIEISIWFDDDERQTGYVRGYILNQNDRCAMGLVGNRVMSQTARTANSINDKSLTDYGVVFDARTIAMNGLNTACWPIKFLNVYNNRLIFTYEPDLGHASLATYLDPPTDINGHWNAVRVMSLRRVAASATMQEIIAANPTMEREYGAQNRPSQAVQRLLDNPDLDPKSNLPVDEIPCRVLLRDQDARASLLGILDIASTMEPNNKLGIRYLQFPGPILDRLTKGLWASRQERYLQIDASSYSDPTFLNLPRVYHKWPSSEDACTQARMVDQFISSFEQGAFESVDATHACRWRRDTTDRRCHVILLFRCCRNRPD